MIAVKVLAVIIEVLVGLFLLVNYIGVRLRKNGQKPLTEKNLESTGSQSVTNILGRRICYKTFGSTDNDAPVLVAIHGSGDESGLERKVHEQACIELGVRGIAIDLPGYGLSDCKPGRVVAQWPEEDLLPILEAEQVENFMVCGHSQGTPHAMAAAWKFPERCIAVGLNAPLLPSFLSREEGIKAAVGSEGLLRTEQIRRFWMGWYFTVYHLGTVTFGPYAAIASLTKGMPKIKADKALTKMFGDSFVAACARGSAGSCWESTLDVCYKWGFDPRDIQCKAIVLMHAKDDNWCPFAVSEFLNQYFSAKKDGTRVQFITEDSGYGHLTFCRGKYLEAQSSMTKLLLDTAAQSEAA